MGIGVAVIPSAPEPPILGCPWSLGTMARLPLPTLLGPTSVPETVPLFYREMGMPDMAQYHQLPSRRFAFSLTHHHSPADVHSGPCFTKHGVLLH